ncbi:MAG: extradiol dioxygenase [Bacteroidota bacterium]
MTQNLWVNLPVKNLDKSKAFFKQIGFKFNEQFGGNSAESACLEIGSKPDIVMLFLDTTFQNFSRNDIADTGRGTEVLLSFDAASKEQVDQLATMVKAVGGDVFAAPEEIDGWMYSCGFADLDGHRWNALYMDMANMPKQ